MYWRMLTCPTADFGCKRCIRWLPVSAFDWDQYHLSWLIGIHVPDTHIFLGELEQSTVCAVDYILLKAKWKIFCTLCTKSHVLSLYFEIPVADSVDWRNYHRISRNHSFVARIYFFLSLLLFIKGLSRTWSLWSWFLTEIKRSSFV